MKVSGAATLRNIDKACVEELGIPMMVLMENAALKLYKHAEKLQVSKFVIAAGTGNNGGDALALARHLSVGGKAVTVFILGDINSGSECFQLNYNILKNMALDIELMTGAVDIEKLKACVINGDVVVDSIFGVGLNREISGIYKEAIEIINEYSKFTLCVDIPSGMQCDTGEVLGCCVKGHMTISFQQYKKGFLKYGAGEYTGQIVVESIGIPEAVEQRYGEKIYVTEKDYILQNIQKRNLYSHKGSFGRTVIVGGSEGFYGAVAIASEAAVRCGSGLVTAAGCEKVVRVLEQRVKEAMTIQASGEKFEKLLKAADGIAVGPGMGEASESTALLENIIEKAESPVVIDADGLNILSKENGLLEVLKKRAKEGSSFIFTPHPGEMARLLYKSVEYVNGNRIEAAKEYAKENGIIVLLKGYNTVITDGEYVYVNPTGSSAMASGGMGDCLTGIIASLLSQGLPPLGSAVCGAYVHGYCGDRLSEKMHSICASDVIEYIPFALKELLYH